MTLTNDGHFIALGPWGEQMAVRYLERRGWKILDRNVRARRCEVDIIALDGQTLVFLEVKTRRGHSAGAAIEAIPAGKRRRIEAVARWYLQAHPIYAREIRFDVVAIEVARDSDVTRIRHVPDAWRSRDTAY